MASVAELDEGRRRRPRTPGTVFAALASVFTVLVALVTFTANQPPPPTIAEFAPQAIERIKDAPLEQSSAFGNGPSGGDSTSTSVTTTTTVKPGQIAGSGDDSVPTVHRCVGDPPRQIEDPESPPCVPAWQGDNGGKTWQGVTKNEIVVAVPLYDATIYPSLAKFMNSRFEFYGRKIRLVPFDHGPDTSSEATMRNDAHYAAKQLGAFASLRYTDAKGTEIAYYDELASLGVVSVDSQPKWFGEDHYAKKAPYEWSWNPGFNDTGALNFGEFVCKQLNGGNAVHAGAAFQNTPRKYGIVTSTYNGVSADDSVLKAQLRACHIPIAIERNIQNDQSGGLSASTSAGAMVDFANARVTTVLCDCESGPLVSSANAAAGQGYFPEWVINSVYGDQDIVPNEMPVEEARHVFGISPRNKMQNPLEDQPSTWAMKEANPAYAPTDNTGWYAMYQYVYPELLLLASGIQMAGPRLTPQTFQEGLFRTLFPNPGNDGPPYYLANVGFDRPLDHTMVNTYAVIWFNPTANSMFTGKQTGAFCYAQRGTRYRQGTWPTAPIPVFTGPCA